MISFPEPTTKKKKLSLVIQMKYGHNAEDFTLVKSAWAFEKEGWYLFPFLTLNDLVTSR